MKKLFVFLVMAVLIAVVNSNVFADIFEDTYADEDYRIVTDMSITFGRSVGLLMPLDKQQEGNVIHVTAAPFINDDGSGWHHDRIDIYADMYDQFGSAMWEEPVIWHMSCSLEYEMLYSVLDVIDIGFNLVILNTGIVDRVITLTATSYSNPDIYMSIVITVDPNRANVKESRFHEGRLFGGRYSRLTVPVIFINVPDGTYSATLHTSPILENNGLPLAHDFSGLNIEGWQVEDLNAVGYITVEDGIGRITFVSYNTPASHITYWTWMTLEVDMLEYGMASTIIQIEFAAALQPPPLPPIVEITILRGDATISPGFGSIFTPFRGYDAHGRQRWGFEEDTYFIWSADGLDEGDYLYWDSSGLNHFIHIGESQRERVITVTVYYTNDPTVYDSIKITVSPYFTQQAGEILFLHPFWGLFEETVHINFPASTSIWISALVSDMYGLSMSGDDLIWTIDSEVETDRLELLSSGFILFTGAEAKEREITITAVSPYDAEIYATFIASVNPLLYTLGILEVLGYEGTLTAGRFDSTVITLSIPYLLDGTYRAMLSIGSSGLRWQTTNPSFENGWALPWGDITFKDGIAYITIVSNHNTLAGEWEMQLQLSRPEELRGRYFFTPFVFFTLTVDCQPQ